MNLVRSKLQGINRIEGENAATSIFSVIRLWPGIPYWNRKIDFLC